MNQIIMWIMAVGAVLGGVDRIAGNRFGLGKRFEEGFALLGPTALSMSGIICLTPLLSRFLRFALVPIWNFLGLDAGLLAGILAIDMGGYQLAGELSASQEMVRYAGLVIAATLGCTITFTIPVGMGMLKSGDRLFFSRGMLIGTGTLPVTMIVGGLLSGLSFLQIVLQSLPVLLFCFLLMFGIWRFPEQTVRAFTVFADVIRLLTTKKERLIRMPYAEKQVSKTAKILFPIIITMVAGLFVPRSVALVGFLMFGNLIRECGVLDSLSETAQKVLANLITLLLGLTVASKMQAEYFLNRQTLMILALGLVAFVFDTIGGVLVAKVYNLFAKQKINPMIGAAGISAFPMSARVVNKMGLQEDNQNFLLMHAVGVNVSGQIASVIAGGMILTLFA